MTTTITTTTTTTAGATEAATRAGLVERVIVSSTPSTSRTSTVRTAGLLSAFALALAPALSAVRSAAAPAAGDPRLPLLTHIRDIRALSPEEGARGYPVRVRGTITYLDEDWPSGLIVHDGTAGQFVLYTQDYFRTHPRLTLRNGDLVEVEGHTVRGGFAPNVDPTLVRLLGRGSLPRAQRLSYTALLSGRYDCEYVEMVGIGQRVWPEPPAGVSFLEVATEGGIVRASLRGGTAADGTRFVDARLRLRGNVGALFGEEGQLRGVSLLAGQAADVVVEEPPPAPFSLPLRSISSLFRYSAHGEVDRRLRVRGVVAAQRRGRPAEVEDFTSNMKFRDVRHVFYLRDDSGAARVETTQETALEPGDLVEVAGFPMVTPTRPALRNAVYRTVGRADQPSATPLSWARPLAPERDAELVSAEAHVLGMVAGPTERALVLQMAETPFEAVLDAEGSAGSLDGFAKGSLVSVTGIYAYQSGPPPSFRLLLRSPADVALVSPAPWWTLRHTGVVVVVLALFAAATALRMRTVASRHLLEREQYRATLAERTRLARELHDTVEQGLAGIKLQLEAVSGSLEDSPQAALRSLGIAREMLRYSMEEARRSVLDLRSQALEDRDVAGALRDFAERMTAGTPLRAQVRVIGTPRPLDASLEHHLFRIGVEALTNAIKHSRAAHRVDVELRFGPHGVDLVVSDDGGGFVALGSDVPGEHFGLRGIRERVDKLGGALRLESPAGGGARLAVSVPAPVPAAPRGQRG
jgi:signal transduction histidine kinase